MICHEIRKIITHAKIFIKISIIMSLEYLFTARVHNTTKNDCTNYIHSLSLHLIKCAIKRLRQVCHEKLGLPNVFTNGLF